MTIHSLVMVTRNLVDFKANGMPLLIPRRSLRCC